MTNNFLNHRTRIASNFYVILIQSRKILLVYVFSLFFGLLTYVWIFRNNIFVFYPTEYTMPSPQLSEYGWDWNIIWIPHYYLLLMCLILLYALIMTMIVVSPAILLGSLLNISWEKIKEANKQVNDEREKNEKR